MTALDLDAMAAAMGAENRRAAARAGLSIDTRSIAKGEAFFAIKGDNRDGHDFVDAALKAGAGLAVIARDQRARFAADAPLLIVADVLEALRDLARAARARSRAKVVAVTGSVGKTSTKEALQLALAADGETHASAASYNNHWGVPLSLARLPASAKYAVFEIGMNHAGEITPLTKLVRPHVAIVTTIAPVHLEYFGSLKKIADAKAEIFLGLEPGGAAVLNRDNRAIRAARQGRRRRRAPRASSRSANTPRPTRGCCAIRCSRKARPSKRASWASRSPTSSARRASIWCSIRSPCSPPSRWSAPIWRWRRWRSTRSSPPPAAACARTLRVPGGSALLIDESYNANPASMARRHRAARPGAARPARPPHRRARRHAGTRAAKARSCTAASPRRSRPPVSTWCFAAVR